MKILSKNQDIYSVELFNNDKSLTEYIFELRQKKEQQTQITSTTNEVIQESVEPIPESVSKMTTPPPMVDENISRTFNENACSVSLPVQPMINESQRFTETSHSNILPPPPPPTTTTRNLSSTLNTETKALSTNEQNSNSIFNDNLTIMITEQRRQNRLLEQVIAAINTTNALLTQLVQR
ncbi:unnamed protein product, partial [Rotaria sordida]